jgi:DNA ligase (NAD+)
MIDIYKKVSSLVEYLNECTKAYDEGHPLISDEEWDNKYFELKELEDTYNIVLGNSPTQTINFVEISELEKITHNHKMLSLEKTKSVNELMSFLNFKQPFMIMCKMDGLTCSLTYQNGELVAAETRGNGLVGENILHNILTLPSVPKKIPYKKELVIDGEIICTYNDFENFSSVYKNPRNFAAGSIRLLSSSECATRKLQFVVWDVITSLFNDDEIELQLHEKFEYIRPFGFTIVPYCCHNTHLLTEKILDVFINDMKEEAAKASYPIDGAVVKFADCSFSRALGETAHHFKNAMAYKFYDETYPTNLIDIEWTMGRTGTLTPVAIFNTVEIDGTEVSRASLHNISIMKEILGNPYYFQEIEVFKANMIIPQIYSAKKESSQGYMFKNGTYIMPYPQTFKIPEICPICGGSTKEVCELGTTVLQCSNPACEGKLINRIDHFCGKKGLDMKGISKATLEKLIDWGWVNSITDIFELSQYRDEWIKKPGFGAKSVDKILNAISESCKCDLHQFIASLGIPLIGTSAAKSLADSFKKWNEFICAVDKYYDFSTLPNFGFEMNNSICSFNYSEARYIADNYILFNDYIEAKSGTDLAGKTFVITGKLTQFKNRDEIKSKIESLGGKVAGSVSKNTDYLINNDVESTSSKNKTAKTLGIPILSENDFIETFGIK